MIRYKCPACGKQQFSASITKRPCIHCGSSDVYALPTLESGKEPTDKKGIKENEQIL